MAILSKVKISPRSSALPTVKLPGLNPSGELDQNRDFFKDTLRGTWWRFLEKTSVPQYDEKGVTYAIGIKSAYTCTGDGVILESRKQEYLRLALKELFVYYNKEHTDQLVEDFATSTGSNGSPIAQIVDYHLSPRPSDKVKFLVEVNAEYFNAVPQNALPSSFANNRDSKGKLIIVDGMLNPHWSGPNVNDLPAKPTAEPVPGSPAAEDKECEDNKKESEGAPSSAETGPENAVLSGYEDISIISLRSDTYENELIKTAAEIVTHNNNLLSSGYTINGADPGKEGDRILSLPTIIESYISRNYCTNGVGTGKGSDGNYTEPHPGLSTRLYIINFAVRKKLENPNEFEILWASLNDGKKDRFLGVGFKRFLDSDPINHITTLHYFYWHQQILNNLDRSIELSHLDFFAAYHYPIVDVSELVSSKVKNAPFESKKDEDAENPYLVRPKPKKCGLKRNSFNFQPPSLAEMLQNSFSPINYNFPVINITFFSLGPPCPAAAAGMEPMFPLTYDKRVQRLKDRIRDTEKNWKNLWKEGKESFDHVGDYFTGEEFKNDLEKRFGETGTTQLKLRKLGDLVLNQFSLEKMLQLVCICITQIADDALAEAGYEPFIPEASLTIKGPGVKFNPSMLSDDDPNFGLTEAFEGTMGSMDPPFGSSPFDKKAFKLQELCSMCICLPDILVRLPTFDLLKSVMKMILDLIEALIVQILMSLIMQLLNWLLQCPDYKCELGAKTPAINDYGSHDLVDLLDTDDIACPIFDELDASGADTSSIKSLLVKRISSELTSGELANLLEGYPTKAVVYVVMDIVEYEDEFEVLRPYLSSEASIESFFGCLVDALDPLAVKGFEIKVSDPEYCPSPDNTPAYYMDSKCDNQGETERFLLRDRAAAAANLRSIVDAFRNDPSFIGKLMPTPWTTVCDDGTKIKGFLADDKFKPKVTDTMIETVINPMVNTINGAASRDGVSLIKNFQQRDPKRATRVSLTDNQKEIFSTAQLATSFAIALWAPPAGIAMAPMTWKKSIDTQYPAIGGLEFQEKIKNFEQHINVYYPEPNAEEGLAGVAPAATAAGIPNAGDREFDQRFKFKLPTTSIWLYLETLTPKLLETDTEHGGFQNHAMVRVLTKSDPNYELPAHVADLPDGHPTKMWYESRLTPLFGDDDVDFKFSYKFPMEDINIPAEFSLSAPQGQISYSPQSQVFSKMLQNGLGPVWDAIAPAIKTSIARQFESSLHMYTMRDFIEKLGIVATNSPFFKTYTYEEIKSGIHNLKFSHLEAEDPYSEFGAGVFKQKYGAKDQNGRTSVYYEPRAAINDTPLRKRSVDLIRANDLRDRIKDMWDWTEAYDPDDPNSLPPLSIAIIDGLVEEFVRMYCVEALIKATPAETVFDNSKTSEVRDAMFTTVLSKIIEKDIQDTFPITTFTNSVSGNESEDTFQTELYGYIDSYVARKYMNMGLSSNDAPTGDAAIAAMIDGIGDDEGLLKSASSTAKEAMTIYHLQKVNVQGVEGAGQDLDLPDPLEYVVASNPSPYLDEAPSVAPPMKTFHVGTVLEPPEGYESPIPITKPRFSTVPDLTNGGFVYERYIKITLHEDTKDFFQNHFAWDPNFSDVNGDPVPISLEGSQDVDISIAPMGGSNFAGLASHLYSWIADFGKRSIMEDNYPKAADILLNAQAISGLNGLFQSLTHHVRLSYVLTGAPGDLDDAVDAIKEAVQIDQFVNAGEEDVFANAVKSHKSFILNEAELHTDGTIIENNYVIVLPIVESPGNTLSAVGDPIAWLDTNPDIYPVVLPQEIIQSKNGLINPEGALPNAILPILHLKYLMEPISVDTPEGKIPFKAFCHGHPAGNLKAHQATSVVSDWSEDDPALEYPSAYQQQPRLHYLVPYNTPDNIIEDIGDIKIISPTSKAWKTVFPQEMLDAQAAPRYYQIQFYDLPENHREALIDAWYQAHPDWPTEFPSPAPLVNVFGVPQGVEVGGPIYKGALHYKEGVSKKFKSLDYEVTYPESVGKADGIDTLEAFMGPDAQATDDVSKLFEDTDEWKLLFSYAMPLSVMTNAISLYALLGILERPAMRRSFGRAKKAFKVSLQYAGCKADETGKCPKELNPADLAPDETDDSPPDYLIDPPDQSGNPDSNLTLLYDLDELTIEQVEAIKDGVSEDEVTALPGKQD